MFSLEQAYEALNDAEGFVVKIYEGKIIFDYIIYLPDSFTVTKAEIEKRIDFLWKKSNEPLDKWFDFSKQARKDIERFVAIRQNFRGVVFDENTGEMISLPFHKFHNINQVPSTQFRDIKDLGATIYEKMDGSMIHFYIHKNELIASTCRAPEHPLAIQALEIAKKDNVVDLIKRTIDKGFTPIFEFVSPTNQIVVRYDKSRLVYLASRERISGKYIFEKCYPDQCRRFNFPFVEVFNNLPESDFEGYVCHLSSGDLVKVKTSWYVDRHKCVEFLMQPAWKLYQAVYDGYMDDLIALVAESYRPTFLQIYEEAQRDFLNEKRRVEEEFERYLINSKSIANLIEEDFSIAPKLEVVNEKLKNLGRFEAIKYFKDYSGLSLKDSKSYIDSNCDVNSLPSKFLEEYETFHKKLQSSMLQAKQQSNFYSLVESNPDSAIYMEIYQRNNADELIKNKLIRRYKIKYPYKIYSENNHEE